MKSFYITHRRLIHLIGQLLLVAVIGWFLSDRLLNGLQQLTEVVQTFRWQLAAAVVLFALAVLVSGMLWGGIIRALDKNLRHVSSAEAMQVHVVSWLLKYVPGQAGSFISKMAWGKKNHVSQKAVVASLLYENIFLASSSVILSLPFLGLGTLSRIGSDKGLIVPFVMTLAVLPLLIPPVFTWCVSFGLRLIGKKPFDRNHALSGRAVFINQVLFLLPRLINGVGFVLLASLFIHPDFFDSLQLTGAYALAGIIGILAVFVPSGLGVREAVIIIAAGPILGADTAAAVAILARVCATIADVVLVGVYGGLKVLHGGKR